MSSSVPDANTSTKRIDPADAAPVAERRSADHPFDFRRIFAALLPLTLALIFFRMIAPFVESLFLAVIFSYLTYPVYEWLRKYLRHDGIAAFVTTIGALIVVALPLTFIAGAVSREAVRITEVIGPWVEEQASGGAFLTLPDWLPFAEELRPYRAEIIEKAGEAVDQLGAFMLESLSRVTQGTVAFVLYLFVMLYGIFFLLMRGPALLAVLAENTPLSNADQHLIVERGIAVTRATLKSIFVIGALQGALGGIGFAVAGIEGAAFWGLVMTVASVVPAVGAALIWAPAAVILALSGNVFGGVALALWGTLVVSSVDNVLRPYLVGHDARLPDLLILVSTLGGLAMFGATGLLIGPVIAGIFLTSLSIFTATFRTELDTAGPGPLIELPEDRRR